MQLSTANKVDGVRDSITTYLPATIDLIFVWISAHVLDLVFKNLVLWMYCNKL